MKPLDVTILQGDCLDHLALLPSDSFDCIVTSPPYWGLRDYGVERQIGLEPTLSAYLNQMTAVCRELRRVLKPGGTFWLNIGDSYCSTDKWGGGKSGNTGKHTRTENGDVPSWAVRTKKEPQVGLKPKDLCMVPNRLAIRLQDDGWYVRSEIIWHKPNPMPESVTDRPTSAHEKLWLLTKSTKYFYDHEAIKEPVVKGYAGSSFSTGKTAEHQLGRASTKPRRGEKQQAIADNSNASTARRLGGFNARWDAAEANGAVMETRNARNVWTIAPHPFKGAHFATFPPELVERCIKAGCPPGGSVLDPFGGAGTTGLVAERLGRRATLIELNPEYVALATARIAKAGESNDLRPKPTTTTSDLFG